MMHSQLIFKTVPNTEDGPFSPLETRASVNSDAMFGDTMMLDDTMDQFGTRPLLNDFATEDVDTNNQCKQISDCQETYDINV